MPIMIEWLIVDLHHGSLCVQVYPELAEGGYSPAKIMQVLRCLRSQPVCFNIPRPPSKKKEPPLVYLNRLRLS